MMKGEKSMSGMRPTMKRAKNLGKKTARISTKRLDEMIEEATVDCYDESEALSGFLCV